MKIYFTSTKTETINQFESSNRCSTSVLLGEDPLYIINLNEIKFDFSLKKIKFHYPAIDFIIVKDDYLPNRINFKNLPDLKVTEKQFLKDIEDYYELKDEHSCSLILKNKTFGRPEKRSYILNILRENGVNTQHNYLKYLTNNAGMYFYDEVISEAELILQIDQVSQHFGKISYLVTKQPNSNILYRQAFNRLDYGVSIVSKDRTIIYTNNVRRQHFGTNIIGKKCYEVFVMEEGDNPCKGCPMGEIGRAHV